jgi:hypothetical protein
MAINLSNVNIAISKFQEVSSGVINAGEIKLTGETSIDKVNNHVRMRGKNKVSQSLAQAIERGDNFYDPHKPQQGAVVFLPFRSQDA